MPVGFMRTCATTCEAQACQAPAVPPSRHCQNGIASESVRDLFCILILFCLSLLNIMRSILIRQGLLRIIPNSKWRASRLTCLRDFIQPRCFSSNFSPSFSRNWFGLCFVVCVSSQNLSFLSQELHLPVHCRLLLMTAKSLRSKSTGSDQFFCQQC